MFRGAVQARVVFLNSLAYRYGYSIQSMRLVNITQGESASKEKVGGQACRYANIYLLEIKGQTDKYFETGWPMMSDENQKRLVLQKSGKMGIKEK